MPSRPGFLKAIRLVHLYLGVFFAPALLFFAFTGAVQTFSLHETTRGSNYQPPRILVILAQIHKKQTPVVADRKPGPQASPERKGSGSPPLPVSPGNNAGGHAPAATPPAAPAQGLSNTPNPHNPLPLKIFFLLVALSLCVSTFSGIYMAYKYNRNKLAITLLLVLGTVLPLGMILL